MKYNLKITKEEIKTLYLSGKTLSEVAFIAGCRFENIRSHLKRMGIQCRKQEEAQRKIKLNQNFFKYIDSEEKAYVLGFLYADGYNNQVKKQISIRLHKKDIDILIKIRDLLFPNKDKIIRIYKEVYADLSINSLEISKDLSKLGCIQQKSLVLKFPNISSELIPHFIRGYFDGDGCISIKKEYQLNITGTKEFITSIQEILIENLKINITKFSKRKKEVEIYSMQYKGRQNCIKILDFLYKDCKISLERKNKLYLSILSQ